MKAVFLDRDGTIGGTGGGIHPYDFSMYNFAPKAIKSLNQVGVKVFLFTNQTRVGRGYFTEDELIKGFQMMMEELAKQSAFWMVFTTVHISQMTDVNAKSQISDYY